MPGGRPTIMTDEVIGKLEEGFAYGMTDKEACFYANIHPDTLYEYQKRNPEFIDRKEALKDEPVMKARKTIVESLDDPNHSKWYLERKKAIEFGNKQEVDHNVKPVKIILTRGSTDGGSGDGPISPTDNSVAQEDNS